MVSRGAMFGRSPPRKLAIVTTLLVTLTLAAPAVAGAPKLAPATQEQAGYLLNRLGYGPKPGDVARVAAMGAEAYIDQQLAPERLPQPQRVTDRLAALPTLHMSPVALFRE